MAEEKTTKRCGAAGQGSRWRRPEAGDWNEMNHVVGVAKVAGEPMGRASTSSSAPHTTTATGPPSGR